MIFRSGSLRAALDEFSHTEQPDEDSDRDRDRERERGGFVVEDVAGSYVRILLDPGSPQTCRCRSPGGNKGLTVDGFI